MLPSRAGSIARSRFSIATTAATQIRSSIAIGSRHACLRPQTKRVANLQSRAFHKQPTSSSQRPVNASQPKGRNQYGQNFTLLQSAFPKKTFAFLVILTGLAYYFVDVRDLDWADDVLNSFEADIPGANPLQFFADKEELDHYLQHHIRDPSQPLRNPQVAQFFSENLDKLAGGWKLTEKDAAEENIPVTHGCRFQSNEPCEDYFAFGTAPGPGSQPWNYWSIMDGHAGQHTAFYLQSTLIPSLSSALLTLPSHTSPFEVESTIKSTFVRVDKQIMDSARTTANWFPAANAAAIAALTPALSGSCALLAAFNPSTSTLHVACTGDSRAVLGRWDPSTQSYTAHPLSEDQTGFNASEISRLTAAHPDEPHMLDPQTGRLLGLAVTRAFGDHRWKWDREMIRTVQAKFWGTSPRPHANTPPYLTAEPEVSTTTLLRSPPAHNAHETNSTQKSDFIILASDGLWDRISSAHAVECISQWLSARARGNGTVHNDPQRRAAEFAPAPPSPTTNQQDAGFTYNTETGAVVDWRATPEYFAIEDENAAVCLVRNALGGSRRGLFMGVLSVPPPLGRGAVDDTTVMVVFFDELVQGGGGGGGETGKGGEKEKKKSWWKMW